VRSGFVVLGVLVPLWGNDVFLSRLWWSLAFVFVLLAVMEVMVGAGREAAATDPASVAQRARTG
jgi:hypothetical protein